MEISANPFAVLTLISAPAVLTNASCVLLFGTGNRYGRAIDRVHQLSEMIETANSSCPLNSICAFVSWKLPSNERA